MNDTVSGGGAAPAAAKAKANVEQVTMQDGRVVDFAGKRKLLKDSLIDDANGKVSIRLDFRNGETRTVELNPSLMAKYAAHGAEQKFGDEIAGLKGEGGGEADIDDMVLAIDDLIDRHAKGEWNTRAEGSGLGGTSVLMKALIEHASNQGKPKTAEEVKAFLKDKTQTQKMALRESAALKPIVERLESEKRAKAKSVDTEALLADFATV